MAVTIGVISIKGGVGKTTISSALASDLANHFGKKVLLVDANYSAPNLGLHMDVLEPVRTIHDVIAGKARIHSAIHTRFGVDVIPGSLDYGKFINPLKLKDRLNQLKGNYDYIIIDSSPALNDELLSAMIASDCLFVVSTPDYPTLSCSLKAAKVAKNRGTLIKGIIINKIREPGFELTIDEIEEATGIPVVAKIPDDKNAIRALFTRIPMPVYNKKSKLSREINNLSAALTNSAENKPWYTNMFRWNVGKEEVNRQVLREDFYKRAFSDEEKKVETERHK